MNFSFQSLGASPDSLPPPGRRLLPFALVALILHGVVVAWPTPRRAPAAASRLPRPVDDTPELLRLHQTANPSPRLAGVPAGTLALADLPPPPPSLLPKAAGPPPGGAVPARPAAAVRQALPAPPLPVRLAELATALRTLQRTAPPEALTASDRDTLVALQRRQWWLSSAQEPVLQRLWQRATPVEPPPESLGAAGREVELRRLPAGVPPELGAGDWHGHSLVGRETTLLLWRHDGLLWLLRLPRQTGGETLTSS